MSAFPNETINFISALIRPIYFGQASYKTSHNWLVTLQILLHKLHHACYVTHINGLDYGNPLRFLTYMSFKCNGHVFTLSGAVHHPVAQLALIHQQDIQRLVIQWNVDVCKGRHGRYCQILTRAFLQTSAMDDPQHPCKSMSYSRIHVPVHKESLVYFYQHCWDTMHSHGKGQRTVTVLEGGGVEITARVHKDSIAVLQNKNDYKFRLMTNLNHNSWLSR